MVFSPSGEGNVTLDINAEDNASEAIGGVMGNLSNMRKAAIGAGGALAAIGVGGLVAATGAAIDFEEAMVEVEKVTSSAMAADLEDDIRRIAEATRLTHGEVATLASQAARFGAEGEEEIANFTETAAKMGAATTLASDEAGRALAKMSTALGVPLSEVESLGDATNELSNNFAANSAEIVDSATRSGQALQAMGLNEQEILGLSAAMNEVSPSSSKAATMMRKLSGAMLDPKNVSTLSSALGVTEEEFIKMREESPRDTMVALGEAMAEGGEASTEMSQALTKRQVRAFRRVGSQADKMTETVNTASSAMEEGGSLAEENAADVSTLAGQMDLLSSELTTAAQKIGEVLVPAIIKVIDLVMPAIDAFIKLNDETDGVAGVAILLGTTLAGLAVVIGAMIGPIMASVSALGTLATALVGLSPPVLAVIAVVGSAIAIWHLFGDDIIRISKNILSGIKKFFGSIANFLDSTINSIAEGLTNTWNKIANTISSVVSGISNTITRVWNNILSFYEGIWDSIFSDTDNTVNKVFTTIKTVFNKVFKFYKNIWKSIFKTTKTLLNRVISFVTDGLNAYFNFWKKTFNTVFTFYEGVWNNIFRFTKTIWNSIEAFITDGLNAYFNFWKKTFNAVFTFYEGVWNNIFRFTKTIWNSIEAFITNALNSIDSMFRSSWSAIAGFFDETMDSIRSSLRRAWNGIKRSLSRVQRSIETTLTDSWDTIQTTIGRALGAVMSSIRSMFESATNFISGAMSDIDRAVIGSLSDIASGVSGWASNLADAFGDAFRDAFRAVAGWMNDMFNEVTDVMGDITRFLSGSVRDVAGIGGDMADALIGAISDGIDRITRMFNRAIPDELRIPSVSIGGGDIDIPSITIGGGSFMGMDLPSKTIGGGDIDIPRQRFGGQSIDLPQLATGGIVDDATLSMIGEGSQPEAVIPLDKLGAMMESTYSAGVGANNQSTDVNVSLRVEGDDELSRIIRENAEVVVEQNKESKQDRLRRL